MRGEPSEPIGFRPNPDDPAEIAAYDYLFERGIDQGTLLSSGTDENAASKYFKVHRWSWATDLGLYIVLAACKKNGEMTDIGPTYIPIKTLHRYLTSERWTVIR